MKRRKSSFVATSHCRFLVSLIHLGRPFLCIRKFNLDPHARRLFGLSKWNHSDGFSLCTLANWNVKWNPNTETDRRPPVPPVAESWVMTSRHDKPLFGLAQYRTGVFSCDHLMCLSQFHAIGFSLIEILDQEMKSFSATPPQIILKTSQTLLLSNLFADDFRMYMVKDNHWLGIPITWPQFEENIPWKKVRWKKCHHLICRCQYQYFLLLCSVKKAFVWNINRPCGSIY